MECPSHGRFIVLSSVDGQKGEVIERRHLVFYGVFRERDISGTPGGSDRRLLWNFRSLTDGTNLSRPDVSLQAAANNRKSWMLMGHKCPGQI